MQPGQVRRIATQPAGAAPAHSDVDASSVLASVGAVFSFFLTAEFEFIVIALPLAFAGLALALTRLHRVRAGQAGGMQAPAIGLALSVICLGFCLAGIIVDSVS